jgi:hypothetical protein
MSTIRVALAAVLLAQTLALIALLATGIAPLARPNG